MVPNLGQDALKGVKIPPGGWSAPLGVDSLSEWI